MDKKAVAAFIAGKAEGLYALSDKIWDSPETAFEEHASAEALCAALIAEGFAVQRGLAGIETAFSGTFGSGRPVIGLLGEFDALSGLDQAADACQKLSENPGGNGHGCGHNMLGVGTLAAAIGIKKYLEETGRPGTVIYFGTPGEEGGSGKAFMAREGAFDSLDFALCWHPGYQNSVWAGSSLANYQVKYKFSGVSAHAAGNPHQGRSALDAVELMNVGVQFLREHIIQEARIHYAIVNAGGYSPNVVQATAEVLYLVRAPQTPQVEEIYQRVNKIAGGAAQMTETQVEIDFVKACSNLVPNNVLERVLHENMKAMPLPEYTEDELAYIKGFADTCESPAARLRARLAEAPEAERGAVLARLDEPLYNFVMPHLPSEQAMPGSTDVGDVSWVCPTSQVNTATWAAGTPGHSWQIVAQGKGPSAHKATLYAGQVLAAAAIDLIERPELIDQARAELNRRLDGGRYVCPIPAGVRPRKISEL